MKGNIGESIAQYVFSKFCLVHKIDGSYDIGNDFICELIRDEYPTNLLFYVQVKYTQNEPDIKRGTRNYWKGSPIPVFLLWIKDENPANPFNPAELITAEKKYKRYTPILHNSKRYRYEEFKNYEEIRFKRDLIVDYARKQYEKGFTPVIEPRSFMNMDEKLQTDLPRYALYIKDVIPEYSKEILSRGWAGLFSLSILLFNKKGKKNMKRSLSLIKLAIDLYKHQRKKNYTFLDAMINHKNEIINEINLIR